MRPSEISRPTRPCSATLLPLLVLLASLGCGRGTGDDGEGEEGGPIGNDSCGLTATLLLNGEDANPLAQVTIENPGDGAGSVQLLQWDLPPDGILTSDLFVVMRDGVPVPYRGEMVKRGQTRSEDYLTLPTGYRLYAGMPLGPGYDLEPVGDYEIRYRARVLFGGPGRFCEIESNTVELTR